MKKIFFLTSAPYNDRIESKSLYQSFDLMAKGSFDPHISIGVDDYLKHKLKFKDFKKISKIYVSEARRTNETAFLVKKVMGKSIKIIKTKYLNEIEFTMKELLSEKKFDERGTDFARVKFVDRFVDGKIKESVPGVISRIKKMLNILSAGKGDILCISHSFYMKIFEIYLLDKNIKSDFSIIRKHFSGKNKLYEPCGGFEFDVK